MMATQVCFPKFPVQQVAKRIIFHRKITWIDQQLFMSAVLAKKSLTTEEKNLVEQIYRGLNQGWIRVEG